MDLTFGSATSNPILNASHKRSLFDLFKISVEWKAVAVSRMVLSTLYKKLLECSRMFWNGVFNIDIFMLE